MKRTFLDASILITAHRGQPLDRQAAIALLNERERRFVSSQFVAMECLPKAIYEKRKAEAEFYRQYFNTRVRVWVEDYEAILGLARLEATRWGLAAMDALHIAAAHLGSAEEFWTTEGPQKPIYRTQLTQVLRLTAFAEGQKA